MACQDRWRERRGESGVIAPFKKTKRKQRVTNLLVRRRLTSLSDSYTQLTMNIERLWKMTTVPKHRL